MATQMLGVLRQLTKSAPKLLTSTPGRNSRLHCSVSFDSLKHIKAEITGANKNIALVSLNRPKELNALCNALVDELSNVIGHLDNDDTIKAIIITGNEKAFAAGADIREMADKTAAELDTLPDFTRVAKCKKPVIAAVNGFALGGGCELAMMCDVIYAGEKAKFGQPEISIGLIPGAGGTQRLTRAIGKHKALELMFTGDMINAKEAEKIGLVNKVFAPDQVLPESLKLAEKIATKSALTMALCKQAACAALEMGLEEGVAKEKEIFGRVFASNDRKEGMMAFLEKRPAKFSDS